MKINKYFNSKFLPLALLGAIVLNFFLIEDHKVKNVDTLVSNSALPASKKLIQPQDMHTLSKPPVMVGWIKKSKK